jgi:hypothetical protein
MKKLVEVVEVEGEGLVKLLGQKVLLLCANYFYAGTLAGVNKEDLLLTNPQIVYETGEWAAKGYKDAQSLHIPELYVRLSAIEAYGEGK